MLTIPLDLVTEQRLTERARAQGVPVTDLLRAMIGEALDDLDDIQMVTHRPTHPLPALTSDQARRTLGLDD